MIYINQHSRQQDEPVFFPVRFVVPVSNSANKDEVEKIMSDGLKQGDLSLRFNFQSLIIFS